MEVDQEGDKLPSHRQKRPPIRTGTTHLPGIAAAHQDGRINLGRTDMLEDVEIRLDPWPGGARTRHMPSWRRGLVRVPERTHVPARLDGVLAPRRMSGQRPDLGDEVRRTGVQRVCGAEFACDGESRRDEVDGDDRAYLEVCGSEDGGHADGAEAVYRDTGVRERGEAVDDGAGAGEV